MLLESPSAMAGVHIAEALRMLLPYAILKQESNFDPSADIPYFRTFTMPWTKYVFTIMNGLSETLTNESGLASFPTLSWVRQSSRPHLTLRRAWFS